MPTDFDTYLRQLADTPSRAALANQARQLSGLWLTETQSQKIDDAYEMITEAADAVTRRLLKLAESELGPPPVAYAWIAYGSQGRRELTLNSDQDNALILAEDFCEAQHGSYFAQLAAIVCDGLADSGFPNCPGRMMACNPDWRMRCSDWQQHFSCWIRSSDRHTARLAGNFFDLRGIAGDAGLVLTLQQIIASECPKHDSLLAHWVANTCIAPAALGIFGRFVRDADGKFDLKHAAIIPLVELARIHALSVAVAAPTGTLSRLQAAAGKRWLSTKGSEELGRAWQFVGGLRLRQQRQALMQGKAPDNRIEPELLSLREQETLRDLLHLLTQHRQALQQVYPHMPA